MFEGPPPKFVEPYVKVRICTNKRLGTDDVPSCGKRGSPELIDALEGWIGEHGLPVSIIKSPCMNACAEGPNMRIHGGEWISGAGLDTLEDIKEKIEARVAAGPPEKKA